MSSDVVGELRARAAAWRYRTPGRSQKIIAVAGAAGKTTTVMLLGEILQETGKSVVTLTSHGCFHNGQVIAEQYDASARQVQRMLSTARKKGVDYVIIEVSDAIIATRALPTLQLFMSVVVNDNESAKVLLDQPVEYAVVPYGFDIAGLRVAPHQAISFGENEAAEAQLARVTEFRRGTELDIVIDHQTRLSVATYLVGRANAFNVTAAVSAAYVLAADTNAFEEGVARLERVTANYDYLPRIEAAYDIVVDAAHNEISVLSVVTSARTLKKRRLLVAADASVPASVYDELKRLSDRVAIVGDVPDLPGVEKAGDIQTAFDLMKRGAKKDDTILLLGTEYAALEPDQLTRAHVMAEAKGE